jgi:hypothetical protein
VIGAAHDAGARVLIDGAQAVSHMPVDVQALDPDFYVFSGHKVFGPTGIGALYGKADVLDSMPPWQGGGNMIRNVTFERTVYQPPPARFEAGTAAIADAVGLGAALAYVDWISRANIASYEHELLRYATRALADVPGLHLVGTAADKASIPVVRAGRVPARRPRISPEPARDRRPVRPPLRTADHAPLRSGRNRAGRIGHVQHARGGGPAGSGTAPPRRAARGAAVRACVTSGPAGTRSAP